MKPYGLSPLRSLTVLSALMVPLVLARRADAQSARAQLYGVVRDTAGAPVPKARVLIVGTEQVAYTDSLGQYVFPKPPAGTFALRVMQIGYRAGQRDSVQVSSNGSVRVDLQLGAVANCDIGCPPLIVPASAPGDSAAK